MLSMAFFFMLSGISAALLISSIISSLAAASSVLIGDCWRLSIFNSSNRSKIFIFPSLLASDSLVDSFEPPRTLRISSKSNMLIFLLLSASPGNSHPSLHSHDAPVQSSQGLQYALLRDDVWLAHSDSGVPGLMQL